MIKMRDGWYIWNQPKLIHAGPYMIKGLGVLGMLGQDKIFNVLWWPHFHYESSNWVGNGDWGKLR